MVLEEQWALLVVRNAEPNVGVADRHPGVRRTPRFRIHLILTELNRREKLA
jgi:hypothetical protein